MSLGDEDETNLLKSLEPWILEDRQFSTFGSIKIQITFIIYMRLRIDLHKTYHISFEKYSFFIEIGEKVGSLVMFHFYLKRTE